MCNICVVGEKNSGKTTLIEALVAIFSRQKFRTATIKHTSHHHQFDIPGKDSHRHRQAGSAVTMVAGKNEIACYMDNNKEYEKAIRQIISSNSDICLIEGDRQSSFPKILLTRNLTDGYPELPDIVATYGPKINCGNYPHFDADDIDGLAEFIKQKFILKTGEVRRA
jgi:molybdopterin-guanine dinucleotide biosynthesis protein MobB